jgi:hypothetical protein
MSKKETTDLISSLCENHSDVKTMSSPFLRAFVIFTVVILYNVIGVYFFDTMRSDMGMLISNPYMIFEMLLVVTIGICAVIAMSLLMLPDMKGQKWFLAVPTTLSIVFLLWVSIRFLDEGYIPHHTDMSGMCFKCGLLYAGVPTFLVVAFARQGASTHRIWLTVMATLTAVSVAWVSLRFVCSMDSAIHVFVDHMLPFTVIGCVFGMFSRRLFSW